VRLGDLEQSFCKVRDRVTASDDPRVNWMRRALVPAALADRAAPPQGLLKKESGLHKFRRLKVSL